MCDWPRRRSRRAARRSDNALSVIVGLWHGFDSGIAQVSLFATGSASYEWIGGDTLAEDESIWGPQSGSTATTYKLLAGIGVERELIEALALRLSTAIAGVTWSEAEHVEMTADGEKRTTLASAAFRVRLRPALDVRFYF
jgi:hypothetical protein